MTIAVNTGFTAGSFPDSINDLLFEYYSGIAAQHPLHQFIFIVDKDFDEKNLPLKNCVAVIAGSAATNPILLQYRLNYTIPAILRKHKADVFVSFGNCSLRCKVPQCMLINDLTFNKKNAARFIAKAKTIVASSPSLKQLLVDHYKKDADAITVMHYGAGKLYSPVTWQEKDSIKETYSEGLEYFLYRGPVDPKLNLLHLLKAFSFFKKRQKSNMQLIIASATAVTDKAFIKSLGSFKYRNEVKVLDKLPITTLAKITGSAYAVVSPSAYENAIAIPAAMQCHIPVIAGNGQKIKDIYGDAALYVNTADFNDIAEKMMLLFKDENKRNELIEKGSQQATLFTPAEIMAAIWKAVLKSTAVSF